MFGFSGVSTTFFWTKAHIRWIEPIRPTPISSPFAVDAALDIVLKVAAATKSRGNFGCSRKGHHHCVIKTLYFSM
jgi:hypothetical protein